MKTADRKSCSFGVRKYQSDEYALLVEMYDNFIPKAMFQGMPPLEKEACRKWIHMLIDAGENFLAWHGFEVVGHVVVLPDLSIGDGEILIFVTQPYRGRGVGSELARMAIERGKGLGLKTIWLTVEAYNFRATRLYTKFGFKFSEADSGESERMMVLRL